MTPPKKTKVEIRLGYFDEPRRAYIALSVGRETILFGADDWPTIQAAVSNEIDKETDLVAIPVDRYNELMEYRFKCQKLQKLLPAIERTIPPGTGIKTTKYELLQEIHNTLTHA